MCLSPLQPRVCALQSNLEFPFLLSFSLFSSVSFTMFLPFPFVLCLFGSLIYICCCFHGHSMCVFVLCRVIWSTLFLVLLSFLTVFFCNLPFFSFSSVFFGSLIYICCNFHGHSMCIFHHYSHVFVPSRAIWSSLFSCPLRFSRSFLSQCFFPVPFFHAFVSVDLYFLCFHGYSMRVFHMVTCFCPAGQSGVPFLSCPLPFFRPFLQNVSFLSLSSIFSCPLIYICCSFHRHSICVFHHYSHVFLLCRVISSPLFSCPLIFSRPFLL